MIHTDIRKIYNIILELQATSSRNDKIALLTRYKGFDDLRWYLQHEFNPFITMGIQSKKLQKFMNNTSIKIKYDDYKEIINYLEEHSNGRDVDVQNAVSYIQTFTDPDLKNFIKDSICKDVSIGATAKTINQVFGKNFIPTFAVLKGHKYIDSKKVNNERVPIYNYKRHIGKDVIITKKWDGNRCLICVDKNQNVVLKSDSGRIMEGFTQVINIIKDRLSYDPSTSNFVLDCELLATNPEGLDSRSLFKKTQTVVRSKGEKDPNKIVFQCFDYIPLDDFMNSECKETCSKRKYAAERMIKFLDIPFLHYTYPLYEGIFDEKINDKLYKQAIENRDEGIIIQLAKSSYLCKRGYDLLKMKANESCDIRCIGVYEGLKERTKELLGGIHVDYKGYTNTDVGGGFSLEERKLYYQHPELIVGKIVQVDFMQEFLTKDGELSMRQPEFRCIREGKTEPSYN